MHRRDRNLLIKFIGFLTLLTLIIYFGGSSPSPSTYPWKKVTYKHNSVIPPSRGHCPGLSSTHKSALVISRVSADGDPSWLSSLNEKYHICIYNVDSPLDTESFSLQTPMNKGHEAMTYLTFLIDNYQHIPAAGVVFVHGSRFAWHNDHPEYDNLALLRDLNIESALEDHGYFNLRCDWSLSTCKGDAKPQGSLENRIQAKLQPWDKRAVSDAALPAAIAALFGEEAKLDKKQVLRSQCCAQFVVGRGNIWSHEREEYVKVRQWLLYDAPGDDKVSGRVLSYLWHVLFLGNGLGDEEGEGGMVDLERLNERACRSAEECYCKLYGKCGLSCKDRGSCAGMYTVPKNYRLPEDWAERHTET